MCVIKKDCNVQTKQKEYIMNTIISDFKKQSIQLNTKNAIYWMMAAIKSLQEGHSAVYDLSCALNYAHNLSVDLASLEEEQIARINFKGIYDVAEKEAETELEEDRNPSKDDDR